MIYSFDKTTEHTEELIFVAKAVLKKDPTRPHLQKIYSTGAEIVATDGCRLHVYEPDDCPLPEGYYQIVKRTKASIQLVRDDSETMPFPPFGQVIPGDETRPFPGGLSMYGRYAHIIREMQTGTIDWHFFEDADMPGETRYYCDGTVKTVKIVSGVLMAIIMPMIC